MMRMTKFGTVFFIILALAANNLSAAIIEIGLTAEIIVVDDRAGLLEGQLEEGDTITGSYIYDSATPDLDLADPSHGSYLYNDPPYGICLNTGGFVFQTDPDNFAFQIGIGNKTWEDYYLLRSYNNLPLSNGVVVDHISWHLGDYSGTALSSDALPTTPLVLEDWADHQELMITLGYKGGSAIGARVTSVWLIPEPATIFLLGLGGLVLLRNRRR